MLEVAFDIATSADTSHSRDESNGSVRLNHSLLLCCIRNINANNYSTFVTYNINLQFLLGANTISHDTLVLLHKRGSEADASSHFPSPASVKLLVKMLTTSPASGSVNTSIRVIHLTHSKPRRPGATRRSGEPCSYESGSSSICVASSAARASSIGRLHR